MALAFHMDSSTTNPTFDEHCWVNKISRIVREEVAIDVKDIPGICVYQVPKALTAEKPESYAPQLVAFGPYHHLRPELYQMEKYKLVALKDILSPTQLLNFEELFVDKLKSLELIVRACYQKFMEFDETTLAWILAIDGLFFLNLLLHSHSCSNDDGFTGKKLLRDSILARDLMLLENQIPFILLKEIHKSLRLRTDPDSELFSLFLNFCEAHSPLKLFQKNSNLTTSHVHLLDLMYHSIVQNNQEFPTTFKSQVIIVPIVEGNQESPIRESSSISVEITQEKDEILQNVETILDLADGIGFKGSEKFTKPLKMIQTLPWTKIAGIFKKGIHSSSSELQEITVPSASRLLKFANIKCRLVQGGIKDIQFDKKRLTLYLPEITLNASSEVILRNLVAYEVAMSGSSSVISLDFTQYVNLMNGLIDAPADVRLLRENGVVKGVLSNGEVADLFNGMKTTFHHPQNSKSNNNNIEAAIGEVNDCFNKKPMVKMYRKMEDQIYASWRFFTVVATIFLLALLGLQSFCEIYGCSRSWLAKQN